MKFLDENGLLYLWNKVKGLITESIKNKVDKIDGKGLSTNDYTTTEKNKLANLSNYTLPTASAETLGGVKVGAGLTINSGVLSATGGGTADSVDWSNVQNRPTKLSQFTNDSGFQTETQVSSAITTAISNIQGISYEIVTQLPASGSAGIIYLVSNNGANPNIYDEYIFVNNKFEKIGTTDIDLSGYVQTTDLNTITNQEIDNITDV